MRGREGLRTYYFNLPGIFHFFTLPLEIPEKTKLQPWKFHTFLLDPFKIPSPNAKTKKPVNSTLFFYPLKFHFVFNYPIEIPHAISLIPLEIPYPPQPSLLFFLVFFGIAQFSKIFYLFGKKIILTYLYFKKNPWNFSFFYPWKFQRKQSSTPGYSIKLC